ncbi:MAG: hypothetical protein WA584_03930 [Pyrinomonadaceae bacterium]
MNKLKLLFWAVIFTCIFSASETVAQDCSYWYAAVGVKSADARAGNMDKKNPQKTVEGTE